MVDLTTAFETSPLEAELQALASSTRRIHREALREFPITANHEAFEKENLYYFQQYYAKAPLEELLRCAERQRFGIDNLPGQGPRSQQSKALRRAYLGYIVGVAKIMFNAELEAEVANG